MDQVNQGFLVVTVLQLVANVPQVIKVQIASSLVIQQVEVSSSPFLGEWTSLGYKIGTNLLVISFMNSSKLKGAPWVASETSWISLNTIS